MKKHNLLPVIFFLLATAVTAQTVPRDVSIAARDGITLKGTYFSASEPGPGILLLHQCNSDRKTWNHLAPQLAAVGFNVLSIDYRGFGESGGGPFATPQERQRAEVEKWPADIDTAFRFLLEQTGVDRNRIGAAGASCGVNQSIQLAHRHPEVKSLVLLSGITDQVGRDYLRHTDWLPILASASDDDGNAVQLLRWVQAFSHNSRNQFVQYKAAGHGTEMFAVEKGLEPMIVEWFEKTLRNTPPAPATNTAAKPSPTEEFWTVLESPGGAARARQLFAEAKKRDPNVFLFPEFAVNLLGYERLQGGKADEAIEIFKLNVDAYPNSPNVYDSLADAYVAAGNRELAIQFSEKALELLTKYPPDDAGFAANLRQSAEDKLRKLRLPAPKSQQ